MEVVLVGSIGWGGEGVFGVVGVEFERCVIYLLFVRFKKYYRVCLGFSFFLCGGDSFVVLEAS